MERHELAERLRHGANWVQALAEARGVSSINVESGARIADEMREAADMLENSEEKENAEAEVCGTPGEHQNYHAECAVYGHLYPGLWPKEQAGE